MATRVWNPSAIVTRQVDTFTIGGTLEIGDLLIITIGQSAFSHSATSATLATAASAMAVALQEAITAGTYPEFTGLTAAYTSGGAFTLTGKSSGEPFTAVATTTESNGGAADAQTFGSSTTTTATSQNHWIAANFGGTLPIDADTVVVPAGSEPIYWGLDQSGIQPTLMIVAKGVVIGLPERHEDDYDEYRDTYLKIGPVTLRVGETGGSSGTRIKINTGTDPCAATIFATGTSADSSDGIPAFLFLGTGTISMNALAGTVGIAYHGGEAATVATLRIDEATVTAGSGATLTTVTHTGKKTITVDSNVTTLNIYGGGTAIVKGTATATTVNCDNGTFDDQGSGTKTTVVLGAKGVGTKENNPVPVTWTNTTMYKGAKLRDPSKAITHTNGIVLSHCFYKDVDIDFGPNRTITPA